MLGSTLPVTSSVVRAKSVALAVYKPLFRFNMARLTTTERLWDMSLYIALLGRLYKDRGVEGSFQYLAADVVRYAWPWRRALISNLERPAYAGSHRVQYAFLGGDCIGVIVAQPYGSMFCFNNARTGAGFGRVLRSPDCHLYECFDFDDDSRRVFAFDPTGKWLACEGIDVPYFQATINLAGSCTVDIDHAHLRWFDARVFVAGWANGRLYVWSVGFVDDSFEASINLVWQSRANETSLERFGDFFVSRERTSGRLCLTFCFEEEILRVFIPSNELPSIVQLPLAISGPIALLSSSMVCSTSAAEGMLRFEVLQLSEHEQRIVISKPMNMDVEQIFITQQGGIVAVSSLKHNEVAIKGMRFEFAWDGPEELDDADVVPPSTDDESDTESDSVTNDPVSSHQYA